MFQVLETASQHSLRVRAFVVLCVGIVFDAYGGHVLEYVPSSSAVDVRRALMGHCNERFGDQCLILEASCAALVFGKPSDALQVWKALVPCSSRHLTACVLRRTSFAKSVMKWLPWRPLQGVRTIRMDVTARSSCVLVGVVATFLCPDESVSLSLHVSFKLSGGEAS